ncbi:MAG: ASKHA domain-containing protein [Gemmatimonadota bacterium]
MGFHIRFLPEDRSTVSDGPIDLFLAAALCDIWTEQPCGARTVCAKCRVRVVDGAAGVTSADARLLTVAEIADGWRLGCQLTLDADVTLAIPPQTRSTAAKSFGDESLFADGIVPNAEAHVGSSVPAANGESREPADPAFGVAVDIGSTTLAAALVDLTTGRVAGTTSRVNPQVRFGADVISRIHFAGEHADGNAHLHAVVTEAIGEMIADLAGQGGVATGRVVAVACAGNATMTHAAVGADITPLGQAPYEGSFTDERRVPSRELGWPGHRDAVAWFLPMVGHHVGGDTVAAVLACGIDRAEEWQLLIDLGTNTEVVLGCRRALIATSTAAGPAFEGANIEHGMRAAPGAIDRVRVLGDGRLIVGTVANQPSRGICGSGLIDAVAELHRAGVVATSGYMRSRAECEAAGVARRLCERVVESPGGARHVLLDAEVTLTAQDVRQLQLVKGSIAAGIALVVRHAGVGVEELDAVHIAGTFGSFVRKASAQAIGLVPAVDPERVHFVGNAAGVGARMVLVDARARQRAKDIAERCEYLELAGHVGYEDAFCAAIPFVED